MRVGAESMHASAMELPMTPPDRIDSPHWATPPPAAQRRPSGAIALPLANPSEQTGSSRDVTPGLPRHRWLALHADELISRLQNWADELDAREAHLNARQAQQETRDRQSRLRHQAAAADQAERQRSRARTRHASQTEARRQLFADGLSF